MRYDVIIAEGLKVAVPSGSDEAIASYRYTIPKRRNNALAESVTGNNVVSNAAPRVGGTKVLTVLDGDFRGGNIPSTHYSEGRAARVSDYGTKRNNVHVLV